MKERYDYTLYDTRINQIESKEISKKKYNEIKNSGSFKLIDKWHVEFKNSIVYTERYKSFNGFHLFVAREVFK